MHELVQIAASLLVLAAFAGSLAGRLRQSGHGYLMLNATGSGVLAVQAAAAAEWGFLLLEGTWAVVSLCSLASVLTRRARRAAERR